ncbi:MAG: aminotransferase class I/II-fold pyridoxal phosphate-dependent enzyme [Firmicutes bacterium]|nr:aminotransferase class I/II-fold pyridoxal phosphate-dependent enzyme [Bacillota bacterium]
MKYDFTSIIERQDAIAVEWPLAKNNRSPYYNYNIRVKEGFDFIPMWVADMNFPACPTIPQAIIERTQHTTYGYFAPRQEYFESIIKWQKDHHGVEGLLPEHIGYENGVLGGVASALQVLCEQGGKVLVHSPVYVGFTGVLKNHGYEAVHTPLYKDEQGVWRMDYEDMDKKLKEQNIHVAIFCSPQNPTGRVWEKWEIEKAMEIYKANDCFVISDEIWADLILPGHKHIPTQSISEDAKMRTVAMYAPSKTFNLAGLIGSYHIIYNKYLKDRIVKTESLSHYNSMNVLSMHALIGAYKPEGYEWVAELCQVLGENVDYGYDYIKAHFAGVDIVKPQGTYLLYMDTTKWLEEHGKTYDQLYSRGLEYGVGWQNGEAFFMKNTIRMNLALPNSRVREAFDRLDKYVFNAEW